MKDIFKSLPSSIAGILGLIGLTLIPPIIILAILFPSSYKAATIQLEEEKRIQESAYNQGYSDAEAVSQIETISESGSRRTALHPDADIEELFTSIERIPVSNSSAFSEYGYDEDVKALLVTFKDSGISYIYVDVPYEEFVGFEQAASKGRYFNANIKGSYTCYRED